MRLAQKLDLGAADAHRTTALCYEIDARLRPSGNQGMLVTVARPAFAHYHASSAQVWERQALLRARPVGRRPRLAAAFVDAAPRHPAPAAPGRRRRRDPSRPPAHGGRAGAGDQPAARLQDRARRAARRRDRRAVPPAPPRRARTPSCSTVDRVASASRPPRARSACSRADDADALRRGWEFLQRLSSRLRIVENRSISDLDEERGDLDGLARRLGYSSPQRAGGARRALLDDYRRHTADIRAVYARVLGVA